MEQKVLDAYALGYYHGRSTGTSWISDSYTDEERVWYFRGYDKGVADYCEEDEV